MTAQMTLSPELLRRHLDRQRAAGFPAFRGAEVRGRLPLSETLLNEAMREWARGRSLPVELRGLRVLPENRIAIDVNVRVILTIPATITVRLDPGVDVRDGGIFTLTLEGLAAAISPLLRGLASDLPPGVRFQEQQIAVSPRELLSAGGNGDLADLVRRISVATEPGTLYIDFGISVPANAASAANAAPAAAAPAAPGGQAGR